MVTDSLGRTIEYVRVSLTEACNYACPYCRPKGIGGQVEEAVLSVHQWMKIMRAFSALGIRAIRLTGGEPLLYEPLEELIHAMKAKRLFTDISLTTNGSLLAKKAEGLQRAGLDRVNISLDSLTPEGFRKQTGGIGCLDDVLKGIDVAYRVGLSPIKINTVLSSSMTNDEVKTFITNIEKWPVVWRFIEYMPFKGDAFEGPSFTQWKTQLEEVSGEELQPTTIDKGFGPAQYFSFPNGSKVGFIFPMSQPYCENCNRLRVTSSGAIRLCLLRNEELPLVADDFETLTVPELSARITTLLQQRHAHHDGKDSLPGKGMWKIGG